MPAISKKQEKRLALLQPRMQRKARNFYLLCAEYDLPVTIYTTVRAMEVQAKLYRRGRSFSQILKKANELEHTYNRHDLKQTLLRVGPQTGDKIVTHAAPGMSMHNYGLAFDAAPLLHGTIPWNRENEEECALWDQMGLLGMECGLEWGGEWSSFKDYPHFQLPGSYWKDLIRTTSPFLAYNIHPIPVPFDDTFR